MSHIATSKQKIIIISKIRKNCPLKSSYVASRVIDHLPYAELPSGVVGGYILKAKGKTFGMCHLNYLQEAEQRHAKTHTSVSVI